MQSPNLLKTIQGSHIELFAAAADFENSHDVYQDFSNKMWNVCKQLQLPVRWVRVDFQNETHS